MGHWSHAEVCYETTLGGFAEASDSNGLGTRYWCKMNYTMKVIAWRDKKYYDKTLHVQVYVNAAHAEFDSTALLFDNIDAIFSRNIYVYKPNKSLWWIKNQSTSWLNGPYSGYPSQLGIIQSDELTIQDLSTTKDYTEQADGSIATYGEMKNENVARIKGLGDTTGNDTTTNRRYYYIPPYRQLVPDEPHDGWGNNGSDTSNGKDIGDNSGNTYLTISSTYSITRAANTTQKVSWTPNETSGIDGLTIKNECKVEHVGTGSSSPYSFTTPNIIGSSYTAWVKRYYNDYPDVQARSKTITLYTYQKPTLNSISLNKYSISARNNESLTLSLDCNNRKWTIENNFRTGIWSNHKSKYYIDYETTDKSRVLSVAEIKTLAPDTKASNGVTTATISVNRRNLGVSGGNPGNGNLVYETGVKTKEIKVYYTPQDKLNPDGDAIGYYKVERNTRGSTIQPKTTWVLPNTYDISNMTGIDVRIKYPKTDTSGVISGYKIELLLPNDGTHGTDYVWKTLYYYTEEYDYYARISYDDLKRGISGNRIRITPFYIPSNVNQGNTGSYWYGPSTTKDFVDISWMLNDPIIDCPLNGTTWHNHQYRILFKLPVDNDTNYKGTNDIEVHYGSGKYRYQEIEISINGRKTLLGNNAYMNAQNNWVSVTNVNNAKLTYLREIIINPTLIPSYSNESSYRILIRVRKAYGQNTNFDGWSNWSSVVVVNKKTVSNTNVQRHEYIMASHYMNVQNAFNNSLSCYAKKASDNSNFVTQESFDRSRGHNINGPHLSPPENTPLQTVKEYVSEFNDLHQLKTKINSYAKFDTDKNRNSVKLDYQNKLLASFIPLQEFITAAKDQNGATECDSPSTILKGRNYMKYMCDEINNLK